MAVQVDQPRPILKVMPAKLVISSLALRVNSAAKLSPVRIFATRNTQHATRNTNNIFFDRAKRVEKYLLKTYNSKVALKLKIVIILIVYYLAGVGFFFYLTPDTEPCGRRVQTPLEMSFPYAGLMPLAWPAFFIYPPRIHNLFVPTLIGCSRDI